MSKSCHALFIRKTLHIALVRSRISYCSHLWRPHLMRDVVSLERVQRRATKFILQDYSSNYKIRLTSSSLLPLMYWLELHDIMFLVASLKNPLDNFNILDYISLTSTVTRSSSFRKLRIKQTRLSANRHFYFNRVVRLWSVLPANDTTASLPTIKRNLFLYLWNYFLIYFDSNNPCTFHYLCPCSSCIALSVNCTDVDSCMPHHWVLNILFYLCFVGFTSSWCFSINLV